MSGCVVSDKRFVQNGSAFAIAEVVYATDYFSFGMEMPGRVFAGSKYVFGFNTQMKSPAILPGHTTAQFWEYDSRIGRRWELDPKTVTGWSGYACLGDNPIGMNDVLGDKVDWSPSIGKDGKIELQMEDGDNLQTLTAFLKGSKFDGMAKDLFKMKDKRQRILLPEDNISGAFTYSKSHPNEFPTKYEVRAAIIIVIILHSMEAKETKFMMLKSHQLISPMQNLLQITCIKITCKSIQSFHLYGEKRSLQLIFHPNSLNFSSM